MMDTANQATPDTDEQLAVALPARFAVATVSAFGLLSPRWRHDQTNRNSN
jgi:hypothetical protein